MKRIIHFSILLACLVEIALLIPSAVAATNGNAKSSSSSATSQQSPNAQSDTSGAEKVNVDIIKEKYWAQGNEAEMGVVQNRTYTKNKKWEIGVLGGVVLTDPFLNVNNVGGLFGYHFSEYFSVEGLVWKDFTSNSSALNTLQNGIGSNTNTNKPIAYYGAEAVGSLLYGKLSVLGKSIIYFDLHVLGGLGLTHTENGTYFTPSIGVGEQVYLSKAFSLRLDYRLMYYKETIIQNVDTAAHNYGQSLGQRDNFSNTITVGVSLMFGGPKVHENQGGRK